MHPDDKQDLVDSYASDPFFKNIVNAESLPDVLVRHDGLFYYQSKLCVPESSYRAKLLYDNHSIPVSGHLVVRKTSSRLIPSYFWPKMRETIRQYVQSCHKCQESKPSNQKPYGFLNPLEPPVEPWADFSMDFATPLPKTKNDNSGIVVVVERLTKMAHIVGNKWANVRLSIPRHGRKGPGLFSSMAHVFVPKR